MTLILALLSAGLFCSAAGASEVITFSYDPKGRLVRVQHSGGPVSGVDKQYGYDRADNRQIVIVSGVGASSGGGDSGGGLITPGDPGDPGFPVQPVDPPICNQPECLLPPIDP